MSTATNVATPIVVSDFAKSVNPKLEYTNYYEWSRQFEIALRTRDLVHYIYPSDDTRLEEWELRNPEPEYPSEEKPTDDAIAKYDQASAKWDSANRLREIVEARRSNQVAAAIHSVCGKEISRALTAKNPKHEMSPEDIWKFLRTTCESRMKPTVNRLIREMNNMKQGDDEPINALIIRISDLQESLSSLSKETSERDLSMILLNALRDEYAISVESCTASLLSTYADKTPSERLEYVISVLTAREEMLSVANTSVSNRAFQTTQIDRQPRARNYDDRGRRDYREQRQQRGGRNGRGGRGGRNAARNDERRTEARPECWTCGSTNHRSRSCPLNRNANEPTSSGRDNVAASAMA